MMIIRAPGALATREHNINSHGGSVGHGHREDQGAGRPIVPALGQTKMTRGAISRRAVAPSARSRLFPPPCTVGHMSCCGRSSRGARGQSSILSVFSSLFSSRIDSDDDDDDDDSAKPTVAKLPPDPKVPADWRPSAEWDPLTEPELNVLTLINGWCDGRDGDILFNKLPRDVVCQFLRAYSYRPDWARASYARLQESVRWRNKTALAYGHVLKPVDPIKLPDRALFERYVQAGPIGFDGDGHVVVLERYCHVDPAEVLDHFSVNAFLAHATYNKEAQRAYALRHALKRGRRAYKVVTVLDLEGLSLGHTDSRFVDLAKRINAAHSDAYPETVHKIFVVNAPGFFGAIFGIVSGFIHPLTASKFVVLGADYQEVLAGAPHHIKFDDGGSALPPVDAPPSWSAVTHELAREWGGVNADTLARGGEWPRADYDNLRRRGIPT